MVWLYWLQDRDIMLNQYNINHPADDTLYPAGKVAILKHLATLGFAKCDHTVSKLSADAGLLCSEI